MIKWFIICLFILIPTVSIAQNSTQSIEKDWVEYVIENDQLERQGEKTLENVEDQIGRHTNDSISLNPNDSVVTSFEFKTKRMRDHITSVIGQPNGNYYVLLLLSLAIALEMVRVYYGNSVWSRFIIRVSLVIAFIMVFPSLFNGVELFFQSITKSILGGQSSLDLYFVKQGLLIENIYTKLDGFWTMSPDVGVLLGVNLLSGIFALVVSYALYLLQNCILVVLYYLGPLIVSLAIINETDYTKGYLETLIETCLWPVIAALLIQLISASTTFDFSNNASHADLLIMVVINICYGLSMFMVPIIANSLVSGRGVGAIGMAGLAIGTRALTKMMTVPKFMKNPITSHKNFGSTKGNGTRDNVINARFKGYGNSGVQPIRRLTQKIYHSNLDLIWHYHHIGEINEKNQPQDLLDIIHSHQIWLSRAVIGLALTCFLLIIACIAIAKKPPKVVRIDGCGNQISTEFDAEAYLENWKDKSREFVEIFLDNYLGLRSNHVAIQLKNSLQMMAPDLAEAEFKYISKNNLAKKIEIQNIRHEVEIQKLEFKDEGNEIFIYIEGLLIKKPIDQLNKIINKQDFKIDLVLEKVKANQNFPFGLIVREKHLTYDEN